MAYYHDTNRDILILWSRYFYYNLGEFSCSIAFFFVIEKRCQPLVKVTTTRQKRKIIVHIFNKYFVNKKAINGVKNITNRIQDRILPF